ncbi:MAG: hypothetical protein HY057_10800 [Rhodospirillales bacterium]|nr:hypothetical protein [Rhodospirillales bacterium]
MTPETTFRSPASRQLTLPQRCAAAMRQPGWVRGAIRVRRQFADEARAAALRGFQVSDDPRADRLHQLADHHERVIEAYERHLAAHQTGQLD